ncbi:hypothetical protein ABQE01_09275 [Enterococcus thailandicus]|uniref:hypothetical protein n=1 Tax=Enterococcus thailandicus TaxID=417368 RepID=UPI0032E374B2
MTKFIETRSYNSLQNSGSLATKAQVLSILGTDEISNSVKNEIDFINSECNIEGSKEVIQLFKQIKNKKYDQDISTQHIKLIGFDDKQQIILGIVDEANPEEIIYTAKGIYSFSNAFLDDLFCLDKFSGYCFRTDQKDLLIDNIKYLLANSKEIKKQYRFIEGKKDGEVYLRALTSSRYRNYDNNIVLYLSLNAMHQYSNRMKNPVYIDRAFITDSSLFMSVKLKNTIPLGKKYQVEIGINVSNSEIREGVVLFELSYTIIDRKGIRSTAIGDSVLKVKHNLNAGTVKNRMKVFNNLEVLSKDFISGIDEARLAKKLDADQLSVIFDKLAGARTKGLGMNVKQELNKMSKEVSENTYSLLELFNKLESIDATVDDMTYIQRKFSEFVTKGFR